MSHDPLSISNTALELARGLGLGVRPWQLQRIVYFAHGLHLVKTGLPLVSGCFEAWKSGPVHPVIYLAFARAGSSPIDFRATRKRGYMARAAELPLVTDPRVVDLLLRVISPDFGGATQHLSRLASAKNAPWHFTLSQVREAKSVSLRITNTCIVGRFHFHKADANACDEDVSLMDVPFSLQEFVEMTVPA